MNAPSLQTAFHSLLFLTLTTSSAWAGLLDGEGTPSMPGIKTLLIGGALLLGGFLLFRGMGGAAAATAGKGLLGGLLPAIKGLFSMKGLLIGGAVLGGAFLFNKVQQSRTQPPQYLAGRYDRELGDRYQNPAYWPNGQPPVGQVSQNFNEMLNNNNGMPPMGNAQQGYMGLSPNYGQLGMTDQLKMFVTGGAYVPPQMMMQDPSMGGMNPMAMGANPALYSGVHPQAISGNHPMYGMNPGNNQHVAFGGNTLVGNSPEGYIAPEFSGAIDRLGRAPIAADYQTAVNRNSVRVNAPSSETEVTVEQAEAAKDQSYDALVAALGKPGAAASMQEAFAGYQASDEQLRAVTK